MGNKIKLTDEFITTQLSITKNIENYDKFTNILWEKSSILLLNLRFADHILRIAKQHWKDIEIFPRKYGQHYPAVWWQHFAHQASQQLLSILWVLHVLGQTLRSDQRLQEGQEYFGSQRVHPCQGVCHHRTQTCPFVPMQ